MKGEHISTVAFLLVALLVGMAYVRHRRGKVNTNAGDPPSITNEPAPKAEVSLDHCDDRGDWSNVPQYIKYNTPIAKNWYKWVGLPLLEASTNPLMDQNTI